MINEKKNDDLFFNEELDNDSQTIYKSSEEYNKTLMNYGQNRNSLIFVSLHLAAMLLSWLSIGIIISLDLTVFQEGEMANIDFLKPFLVLIVILVSVVPIGLLIIYLGSLKSDIEKVLKGLKTLLLYLKFVFALYILLSVIFGFVLFIMLINLLYIAFILAIMGGLILGFYFKFIKLQIEFVEDCIDSLTNSPSQKNRPRPMKFKIYLIIIIVLSIISVIVNGISLEVDIPFLYPSTIATFKIANILLIITWAIQITKFSFALYLIRDFDRYLYNNES